MLNIDTETKFVDKGFHWIREGAGVCDRDVIEIFNQLENLYIYNNRMLHQNNRDNKMSAQNNRIKGILDILRWIGACHYILL